ncbi:MAG: iron-containing alcohol dehydrogenase [Casimicrobiaceae bacterium]
MTWRYHNPVDVRFGTGALDDIASLTRGRRVMLVTFPEAAGLGLVARIDALLGDALVQTIDRTEPNPDVASLAALSALMRDLRNADLREQMARAALQAGLAFSNSKTALAHSISYDMTLRHGLPHGNACSFTLPMVLERAIGTDLARDAVLASIFDTNLRDAPRFLSAFLERLGAGTRFDTYGVSDAEAQRMVAAALDGVRGRNFVGNRSLDAPATASP